MAQPNRQKGLELNTRVSARSAGTSRSARRRVSVGDIRWADVILEMEEKHKSRLRAESRQEVSHKELHVLDIPDGCGFMDPELVEIMHERVEALLFP